MKGNRDEREIKNFLTLPYLQMIIFCFPRCCLFRFYIHPQKNLWIVHIQQSFTEDLNPHLLLLSHSAQLLPYRSLL